MGVQQLEQNLSGILAKHPSVSLVYLFGSQATGKAGPTSDYDIGVLIDDTMLPHTPDRERFRAQLVHDFAVALHTDRIDVVLLNDAPIELQHAVLAQGRRLHQRDVATRVEYEARVMSVYGDYLPVLRAQHADILRGDKRGTRVQRYRAALGRTRRRLAALKAKWVAPGEC